MGRQTVVDKRKVSDTASPITTATYAATQSEATLDARLAALDATYYTAARLQILSRLDKEYALRLISESAGF